MRRADIKSYIIIGTSVIVVFGGVNSKCNGPGVYFVKGAKFKKICFFRNQYTYKMLNGRNSILRSRNYFILLHA